MLADLFQEVTTISLNSRLNKVRDVSNLFVRPFNSVVSIKRSHSTLAVMRIVQEDRINHPIIEGKSD